MSEAVSWTSDDSILILGVAFGGCIALKDARVGGLVAATLHGLSSFLVVRDAGPPRSPAIATRDRRCRDDGSMFAPRQALTALPRDCTL